MLATLDVRVLSFQLIRKHYIDELKMISSFMIKYAKSANGDYIVHKGFLFKGNQFCVPKWSFREFLVKETHGRNLVGHFDKTMEILKEHFYWEKNAS